MAAAMTMTVAVVPPAEEPAAMPAAAPQHARDPVRSDTTQHSFGERAAQHTAPAPATRVPATRAPSSGVPSAE